MRTTPKAALAAVGLAVIALAAALPSGALRAQDNEGMGSGMSEETMGSHQQMMGSDSDTDSHMGSNMRHDGEHGMSGSGNGHMMNGSNSDHSMMGSDGHHGMMGN